MTLCGLSSNQTRTFEAIYCLWRRRIQT